MVALGDLNELRGANKQLQSLVEAEVADLFMMLAEHDLEDAQSILHQMLPELVNEYGQIAQATAAEWYESTYGARAYMLDSGTPAAAVHSNVGYQASQAAEGGLVTRLANIQSAAVRHVRNQGRQTITHSAERNGAGWARVPQGAKTCAFCLMLASRDADLLYRSRRAAEKRSSDGKDFHDDCNCEAVQINSWDDYPEGYDPATYYEIYNSAANAADSRFDSEAITKAIRRMHPDLVNDGVYPKDDD